MRTIFILAAIFSGSLVMSQDLNGIWRGTLSQEAGGCFPTYHLEIQMTVTGNTMAGTAYDYYDQGRFIKHHFTGRYNAQTKRMVIIEDRLLQVNIPGDCVSCTKTYDLTWSMEAGKEVLQGDWKGIESISRKACPPGRIALSRVPTTDFPIDIEQPEELAKLQNGLNLEKRENELVTTLSLQTPEVRIDLYDNAEIDNDTVTIFLNNKLLLYKQRLTDKPLTLKLKAFPNTDYELVMYADNLGSIPPNTALMVVTAGSQKQEVRLAASEKKNAAVRFRLKE